MSAQENKTTVATFYEAAGSGDAEKAIAFLLGALDPEVVVHESPMLPWGGEYRGIDQFTAALAKIAPHVDAAGFQVDEIVAEGDSVVARCSAPFRLTLESNWTRTMLCEWFRFRDGRIIEIWPLFFDVPKD